MKCHLCSNEGTIFFTKFIHNKLLQFCYCEDCASVQGLLNTELHSSVHIENIPASEQSPPPPPLSAFALLECPECSFTLEDWRHTRRLGCARCYDVFSADILPYVATIQESAEHTGKSPSSTPKRKNDLLRKTLLQEQLEAALDKEAYEDAARIRDEIAGLVK